MSEALFLREAVIHLSEGKSGGISHEQFGSGSLVFPLHGQGAVRGAVEVVTSDARRSYGPEELRLVSSLTSFCASLVEHALKHAEKERNIAILRYLFDQLPVPVVACEESGRILILNARGASCLKVSKGGAGFLATEIHSRMLAACAKNGASDFGFFVALPGQLMKATVSRCPEVGTPERVYCMTIMDLTTEQERLRQGLFREAFRCRWLNKPLTRITLRNTDDPMVLIELLPCLREKLGSDDRVGPWKPDALGLAFPETGKWQALQDLREWLCAHRGSEMTIGVVTMDPEAERPEAIAENEGEESFRLTELLRPSILLHDGNPEVNDALEFALRSEYLVVKSHRLETTLGYLAERAFDGFFTERWLRDGTSGVELARRGLETNPNIQIFLTGDFSGGTCMDLKGFMRPPVALPKPFRVDELLSLARERLGGGASVA